MSHKDKTVFHTIRFETPLGAMLAYATDQGVCLLKFTDPKKSETDVEALLKKFDGVIHAGENPHLILLQQELEEYFHGKRRHFTIPLQTQGTVFQQSVWEILKEIPYGETRSYKQQAINLNNLKGIRAVASANGKNKIAILIPCHRVIGENGDLTGYAGGLERKSWLLDHERKFSGRLVQGKLDF